MIGSFLTRGLVMILGYAYPAYECYKTVEKNKPEIEQLRFWCQYWILVALLTVSERIGDTFVSWVPMYSEAKLAFFIYLWYPKTRGTTYVYDSFFRPYVAMHEPDIDRNLLELKTRAADMAILYWQSAFSYGQTRIFDILQYVASQSTPTPTPRPARPQQQGPRARQQPAAANRPPATTEPQSEEPPSPTSSTSSSHYQEVGAEVGPSQKPKPSPKAALNARKVTSMKTNLEKASTVPEATTTTTTTTTTDQSAPTETETETEAMQIDEALPSSLSSESTNNLPKETVMEETIRVTRGRLKKTRSGPIR